MRLNNLSVAFGILLLLSARQFVFGQWELLNPKPTSVSLNTVYFLNKNIGFIGGDVGLLMKTTDGGNTWEKQKLNVSESVYAIQFIDENIGYALSNYTFLGQNKSWFHTHLYKTIDGGKKWNILYQLNVSSDPKSEFYSCRSMKVINEDTLYLAGYLGIIKSIDKGVTWQEVTANYWVNHFTDIIFTDNKTGYVCGYSYYGEKDSLVFGKTNDYGKNWSFKSLAVDSFIYKLNSLFFTDINTGYAVGTNGLLFKTIDAGLNWNQLNSNSSDNFKSLWFTDSNIGFVSSDNGKILKTEDAGKTWNSIDIERRVSLNKIFFIEKDYGLIVGSNGSIFKSADNFISNNKIDKNCTIENLYSLSFVNPSTGYICGKNGTVLKTSDAGDNWEKQSIETDAELTYIYFSDENNGILYGKKFNANLDQSDTNVFYRTYNGGKQWEKLDFDTNKINSVSFVNSKTGYASGKNGRLIKTEDGGSTWKKLNFDFTFTIWDLYFKDESFGYAVYGNERENGDAYIIMTTDSGKAWKTINPPAILISDGVILTSVYFIDSITGFVTIQSFDGCSMFGTCVICEIFKTNDGGKSWKDVFSTDIYLPHKKSMSYTGYHGLEIKNISFINENHGYALGFNKNSGDLILETTDKGETWNDISYGTNSKLYSMTYVKPGVCYAVGDSGVIFKFNDTVITKSNSIRQVKDKFTIYPNPADKIIKISSLWDASAYVEIYNLTGMKVLSQRITNNSINITRLSDGMYIVKIITKDNITAAKLIVKH